jgi:hypothetical protein
LSTPRKGIVNLSEDSGKSTPFVPLKKAQSLTGSGRIREILFKLTIPLDCQKSAKFRARILKDFALLDSYSRNGIARESNLSIPRCSLPNHILVPVQDPADDTHGRSSDPKPVLGKDTS